MSVHWQLGVLVVVSSCGHAPPAPAVKDHPSTHDAALAPTGPAAALTGVLQIKPAELCGGAAPPPDYEPSPLAPAPNTKLTVTAGAQYDGGVPVAEMTTATHGTFAAELPAGTYCITLPNRGERPTRGSKYVDLNCLVQRWERCDAVVTVPVAQPVRIDHYEPCSWSICYSGPPPP